MMAAALEYWRTWLWSTATTRLMTVCTIVWMVVGLGWLIVPASMQLWWLGLWGMPSSVGAWAHRPWTILTFMFVHLEFIHLAVNMLWWLMFGQIYEQMQGAQRLMALYLYGGIAGAVVYVAFPLGGSILIGASCSVMAIMGAVVAIMPSHRVGLLFFGSVKIRWIAIVATLFFIVLAPSASESIAHGAALAVGIAAGLLRRRSIDITAPLTYLFATVARLFSRVPVARQNQSAATADAETLLDDLLKKVSRSGYASLTPQERQRLFDLSQRFNHHR